MSSQDARWVSFETPPFLALDSAVEIIHQDGSLDAVSLTDEVILEPASDPFPHWLTETIAIPESRFRPGDRLSLTTEASASGVTGYKREWKLDNFGSTGLVPQMVEHQDRTLAVVVDRVFDAIEVSVNGVALTNDGDADAQQLDEHHVGVTIDLNRVGIDTGDVVDVAGFNQGDHVTTTSFVVSRTRGALTAIEGDPELDLSVQDPTTSRVVTVMWRDEMQTFGAFITDDSSASGRQRAPETLGTQFAEHPTVASLAAGIAAKGVVMERELAENLEDLQRETVQAVGESYLVGIRPSGDPMLLLVTPSNDISALPGRKVLSVDGPNWGFSGNGPAEAAEQMLRAAVGEPAASDLTETRAFMRDVVGGLPTEFSMRANDVFDWYSSGSPPEVQHMGSVIEVAKEQVSALELDSGSIARDIAPPQASGPDLAL